MKARKRQLDNLSFVRSGLRKLVYNSHRKSISVNFISFRRFAMPSARGW